MDPAVAGLLFFYGAIVFLWLLCAVMDWIDRHHREPEPSNVTRITVQDAEWLRGVGAQLSRTSAAEVDAVYREEQMGDRP